MAEFGNKRATDQAKRAAAARKAGGRKRFVHPATCERVYTAAETEFLLAMEAYTRLNGRRFPTYSEILGVLVSLGYSK